MTDFDMNYKVFADGAEQVNGVTVSEARFAMPRILEYALARGKSIDNIDVSFPISEITSGSINYYIAFSDFRSDNTQSPIIVEINRYGLDPLRFLRADYYNFLKNKGM